MTITIDITNNDCKIVDKLSIDQLKVIQDECSFKVQGGQYIANNYRSRFKWDGYKRLFNVQTRRFPVGLLTRVVALLESCGFRVKLNNKRQIIDSSCGFHMDKASLINRQYQEEASLASLVNGNGIVKVATGGGKTTIAALTIAGLDKKTVFIVHTRDLMYQAMEAFDRIFPDEEIGQIGDGVIKYENITIATMQTLAILSGINKTSDYEKKSSFDEDGNTDETELTEQQINSSKFFDYARTVQCVMMDEVQIVSSKTAQAVRFLFDHANYAFGYSASPWRDDGSDLAIEAAFGKRIVDIDASTLIDQGYLVQPTIYVRDTHYDNTNQPKKYVDIYKQYIVENDDRNKQVAMDAIKFHNDGYNTLILVTQIKHGNLIKDTLQSFGVNALFISGKSYMKVRKQAIQDMRDGKVTLMIASTIADVGLDIPRLGCIIEAGAGKSSVTALQRLGRIMRPFEGKDKCIFVAYRDHVKYISDHITKKIEIWQTEPKFIIKDKEV